MNCTLCEHPNDTERNYCGACGGPLARYCRHCGFRNSALDRFCGGCGAALSEVAARQTTQGRSPNPPPEVPEPAHAPTDSAVAELLEAAREGAEQEPEDSDTRVSQNDIDSLFGG